MKKELVTMKTAAEIQKENPEVFERLYTVWREARERDGYLPWAGEINESFRAAVKFFGAELNNRGDIVADTDQHPQRENYKSSGRFTARNIAWFERRMDTITTPYGIETIKKYGKYGEGYRAGKVKPCPFTGFYADDNFLDNVREGIYGGGSIKDAIVALDKTHEKLCELEWDDYLSEREFLDSEELYEVERDESEDEDEGGRDALIAAAPELFEALENLMGLGLRDDVRDTWADEFAKAAAALAKAKGE